MKRTQLSGILGQRRLLFQDNDAVERYYEEKYRHGGYEAGCVRFGVNISALYHQERHRAAIRFLRPAAHEVILDAGCGNGRLAVQIAPQCRSIVAVDIAGNAFPDGNQVAPNLRFEKMNVEALSFPAATFDQAVSVETLEHVLNPERALAELHRVIKPGGRLVITYPTINRTVVQTVQRALRLTKPIEISEHLTEWSYAETIAAMAKAGFVLEAAEGLVFDFGVFGALKSVSRFFAMKITALSLRIRSFPRNSAFVCFAFRRR